MITKQTTNKVIQLLNNNFMFCHLLLHLQGIQPYVKSAELSQNKISSLRRYMQLNFLPSFLLLFSLQHCRLWSHLNQQHVPPQSISSTISPWRCQSHPFFVFGPCKPRNLHKSKSIVKSGYISSRNKHLFFVAQPDQVSQTLLTHCPLIEFYFILFLRREGSMLGQMMC